MSKVQKTRFISSVLLLIIFTCLLFTTPAYAVSLDSYQGVVGSTITLYSLTAGQSYIVLWDGSTYTSGTVPTGGTIQFTIPETTGGSHTIAIQCPAGTTVLSSSYTIIPSITISPTYGTPGTTVSVTGKGFYYSETSIQILYDSTAVITSITADTSGSWTSSFTTPVSYRGSHLIDASGSSTLVSYVEDKTFTIKPSFAVTPVEGSAGTIITASGSGFAASESSIRITFDSKDMKTGITADSYGSWNTTLSIPSSSGGSHTIDSYGSTTTASEITDIYFTISSGISIEKDTVFVGDAITVTGSGFSQYETSIYITYDGTNKSSSISADGNGQWSVSFTIPSSASGSHTIDAHGASTSAYSVADKTITVMPKFNISPTNGNVGDSITATGTGFGLGKTISIVFGSGSSVSSLTADSSGNFSGTFKVPKGKNGEVKVTATDANNISATATFTVETTPPPIPKIISPLKGNTVGFFGDVRVQFTWADVTDPSGVTYDFQVASDPSFNTIVFAYNGLAAPLYESTEKETLPQGEYYWRVRAVDGAGNASEWTSTTQFKAGLLSFTTFIIIVSVAIVILLIILRARAVFSKKNSW